MPCRFVKKEAEGYYCPVQEIRARLKSQIPFCKNFNQQQECGNKANEKISGQEINSKDELARRRKESIDGFPQVR